MKKCQGIHKRNQWQFKSNCGNGRGPDVHEIDSFAKGKPAFSWNPQRQHSRGKPRGKWMRMIKEEAAIVEKTWRKVKVIAGDRVYCYCFLVALCSEVA
jgi:hypothetical protein